MKRLILLSTLCVSMILSATTRLCAQSAEASENEDKWLLAAAVDVLSQYEWRGFSNCGMSFQPQIELSRVLPKDWEVYGSLWFDGSLKGGLGSFPLGWTEKDDYGELDASLGVYRNGLDFCLTGYFSDICISQAETAFALDAALSYESDFGLSFAWSTLLVNPGYIEEGFFSQPFDTYLELGYDVSVWELDLGAKVGAVPWYSPYIFDHEDYDCTPDASGFHFTKLALQVGHTFTFADERCSLPLALNYVYSPVAGEGFLQLKVGFAFDASF